MKVVINRSRQQWCLSEEAQEELREPWMKTNPPHDEMCLAFYGNRTNPALIACIERLGKRASDGCELKVVTIPDDVDWEIVDDPDDDDDDYGGAREMVQERHRVWK